MKYRLIKIEFSEAKKRLNRTFYFLEDANLLELAVVSLSSMLCWFYHGFEFETKDHKKKYVTYGSLLDVSFDDEYPMAEQKIKDMPESLTLTYDFGQCWDFDITISKDSVNLNKKSLYVVVEGTGLGMWEDRKDSYLNYVEGEVDKNLKFTKQNQQHFPVNINLRKLSEQDMKITPELIEKKLMSKTSKILKLLKDGDKKCKIKYLSHLKNLKS